MGRRFAAPVVALLAGTPAAAPAQAGDAYVVSQEGGVVTRIDVAAGRVAAMIPVGPGPAGIAPGPDGRLYVTHPDHRLISEIDAAAGRVVARLPHAGTPFGIAVAPAGDVLFVGDWVRHEVARLDARTGAPVGAPVPVQDPAGLVLDRAGGRLYVAERDSAASWSSTPARYGSSVSFRRGRAPLPSRSARTKRASTSPTCAAAT